MKTKNFFRLGFMLVMGLTFAACSQSDDVVSEQNTTQQEVGEDGLYHYTMQFNCDAPSDDDADGTRAVSYDWTNGATLYVRFNTSGSNYVTGTATYSSSQKQWSVSIPSSLSTSNNDLNCELYYFVNPVSVGSSDITLDEKTACYYTTSASYRHPSGNSISVNGTLNRKTWRLRFKGTSGTTITLPASSNDIKYLSSFNRQTGNFTDSQKDISLTVNSNGYTPYIYGTFMKSSGSNTITVDPSSDSEYYYDRSITTSQLSVGESAYLAIPTQSSTGWTKHKKEKIDPNATIKPNYLVTFTDGVAMDWNLGSTVNTFDFIVFTKSGAEEITDDDLLTNEIYGDSPCNMSQAEHTFMIADADWFKANTEYYLCAVAKNSSGTRGPVLRYLFKTNSTTLPYAEISNIKASTTTKWTWNVALKNNAKSYYLAYNTTESNYNRDWHFFAYNVHYMSTTGQLEAHDWTSVAATLSGETCKVVSICSWGLDANKNIGNPNVAYGSTSSSARRYSPIIQSHQKEMLSKDEMQKMRKNTVIFRVQQ